MIIVIIPIPSRFIIEITKLACEDWTQDVVFVKKQAKTVNWDSIQKSAPKTTYSQDQISDPSPLKSPS